MDEHVYPNEPILNQDATADALVEDLRAMVKEQGLWAPHIGPEAGGTGTGFLDYAYLNEEIGRSVWAQLIFGCQAPDTGNSEILLLFGTEEQKQQWLLPLVAGEIRSFFSMTEPEVSGADPTGLRTRAVRDGDDWVIDGHKWFSCGADGATFANRDGGDGSRRTAARADEPDHRAGGHAGLRRRSPGARAGTRRPRVVDALRDHLRQRARAGDERARRAGDGFRIAQRRLGPGRIHHCMRWLGQMRARVRAHVRVRAAARGLRRHARGESRPCRTGSRNRRRRSRRAGC